MLWRVFAVASLFIASCLSQAPTPSRVTLVFGGDVIPHQPIKQVASLRARGGDDGNNEGWDHVVGPLAPALQRADFAIVNLETPVVVLKKPETGEMIFNARPALLGALKRVGVDVATFANNHCLDQHREGITATRGYLKEVDLLSAGADTNAEEAWKPLVVEKHGLRIGILAVTRWLNGFHNKKDETMPHVPAVPYPQEPIIGGRSVEDFLNAIRSRSAEVDALIVSIHWGTEYKFEPEPADRKLAQQMVDAGAFAVIGHHPHVLQPVEFLKPTQGDERLVVFSLGNLVSNQDFADANGAKRDGLLAELELVRDAPGKSVRLKSFRGIPVATENRLGRGKYRNVQAVLLEDELTAIEDRLVELRPRTDAATRGERLVLEGRRQVALARRARINAFLIGALRGERQP